MVTDEMVEKAADAMARQDITFANCDRTWQRRTIRAALEAALPGAELVAWRYRPPHSKQWQFTDSYKPTIVGWICEPLYDRPHQTAPSVAVKALEWTQFTERSLDLNADSIEGAYVIRPSAGNKFPVYLWVPGVPYDDARLKPFNDVESAKSAANTHHEALIRSALSAQVQDVAEGKELGRFELWFFHHLTDDQRTALFALNGYPTTGMDTHGKQKIALKHWFSRLPAAPAKQEGVHD